MNRNINYLIILLFLLPSCGTKTPEPEGAAEGKGILTAGEAPVTLSADQIEMAGIELGMPERRLISTYVECTGKVEVPPQSLVSVYSPVNGFVKDLRFLPGDYVRKGELLTVLSHPDIVRLQRTFLESKSRLAALELDLRRKQGLAEVDATSNRTLEQARADFEMEQAHYKGLRAELELVGLPAKKLEQGADIVTEISLYAPVSGYINQVNVNMGKLVTPDDLLYEIIDTRHMHLELQVFSKDVDKIKPGQRIDAWMPGREKRFPATVRLIGRMIDPETKTTLVHGHFGTEPVPVTAGTFMHAHIYAEEAEALVVPSTAVMREGEYAFVFIQRNEAFVKQPVTLGRVDGDYIEIRDLDLQPGEKLAVKGAYYINGSTKGDD